MNKNDDEIIDEVVDFINAKWDQEMSQFASFSAGADGDEQAARNLIETFLDFCDEMKISAVSDLEAASCLSGIKKMLLMALNVDMEKKANRKGDLPRAMGFVGLRDSANMIRDRVIYYTYDWLYDLKTKGRTHDQCADLIARAFEKTGKLSKKDTSLTTEKITKTYQRMQQEIIGS